MEPMQDKPRHPPEPEGEYVTTEMDDVQCPECGKRDGIERTEALGRVQPVPPERAGHCEACGHVTDPLAFHHEYKWSTLTEEERDEVRKAQERYEDAYCEYQYSAAYISAQREP